MANSTLITTNPQQPRQRYESLNTLKGLACIGVVILHCAFPGTFGKAIAYMVKPCVPCFFMISGFFLYTPDNDAIAGKVKRQLPKIFRLLIGSVLFYALFDMVSNVFLGTQSMTFAQWLSDSPEHNISVLEFVKRVIFGTFYNNTLWYIHALLWAYVIFLGLAKRVRFERLIPLAPILLVLHIVTRIYCRQQDFGWYEANYWRSFLLDAIPWMLTGFAIAKYKERLVARFSSWVLGLIIVVSYAAQLAEYTLYHVSLSFYFSTLLFCVAVFLFFVKNQHRKYNNVINWIGTNLSMQVYIIHYAIIQLLCDVYPVRQTIGRGLTPILVVLLSILAAIVWVYGQKAIENLFNKSRNNA